MAGAEDAEAADLGVGISRRSLLQRGAVAGTALAIGAPPRLGWAQAGCPPPPALPRGLAAYQSRYVNWAKAIDIDGLWTCAPKSAEDVVRLANWAHREGYRLRPRGAMHGWSPITVTPTTDCSDRVLMADTTKHLTAMRMTKHKGAAVRVQAGASLDSLHAFLSDNGYAFVPVPTTGVPTVGGALAIGAHGASLLAKGERRRAGQTYGSLSNLVLNITVVAWSSKRKRYVLRTFDRSHPDCAALMVHLGRAFVTAVTLRVSKDRNLRCQSYTDIPTAELFGPAATAGPRAFAKFVERSGSVESIWFPFTDKPWLKVWTVSPQKPAASKEVTQPYNYPFVANLPESVTDLINLIVGGNGAATPAYGQASYEAVDSSLTALDLRDLWGKSKNVSLYVKPETLRVNDFGYVVITNRRRLQRAINEFTTFFSDLVAEYESRGLYPANAPVNMRVTGLDRPGDTGISGARTPILSPTAPRRDKRGWDVALWFNVTYIPGTPGTAEFFTELQRFMFRNYRGNYATVRPEWSKDWAFSRRGEWTRRKVKRKKFPRLFSRGRAPDDGWKAVRDTLNRLDPHRVFSNDFLDRLL